VKRPLPPVLALATVIALVATAPPAAAAPTAPTDPPRPTDYRSTVTSLTPPTDAVRLSVVGGDAFLQLHVTRGHEVVVMGLNGRPYLRVGADGTVDENRNSPDTYTNRNRYAQVTVPRSVDPTGPPRWRRVGGGGSYVWHDHRIHWMSPEPPPGVTAGQTVQRWQVPLQVDGRTVTAAGILTLEPAEAWWPWALLVLAVGLAVTVAGWRRGRQRGRDPSPDRDRDQGNGARRGWRSGWARETWVGTGAAGVACALATLVAVAAQMAIPEQAGRNVTSVVVPGVGVLCTAAAVGLRRRPGPASALALAATAAAGGWAILRVAVFTKSILPTNLAPDLDRAGTALAMGLAFAAAVLLSRPRPRPVAPDSSDG
jgi:hypothetical protein